MTVAMAIGERLREARELLRLTQDEASAKFGVGKSTYQKYEAGGSVPGGEAIEGMVRAGLNANWLLTGEGPMLLETLQRQSQSPSINTQALTAFLEAAAKALPHASTADIAQFTVTMYRSALEHGLLTAEATDSASAQPVHALGDQSGIEWPIGDTAAPGVCIPDTGGCACLPSEP